MYSCSYLLRYFWVWDIFLGIIKKTKNKCTQGKIRDYNKRGENSGRNHDFSVSVLIEPFQSEFSVIL